MTSTSKKMTPLEYQKTLMADHLKKTKTKGKGNALSMLESDYISQLNQEKH